uniref:Uncharacterized protein n=1 Tax=Olisthodiscus luteus TaxID=83000 RepID=A0A7U0KST5_OLILU|nr:hypothetical protein K4032_pgp072 [Olisthodiscus luteus]QQW50541.1 hypothetical protein [Olisthodiscus luteus]
MIEDKEGRKLEFPFSLFSFKRTKKKDLIENFILDNTDLSNKLEKPISTRYYFLKKRIDKCKRIKFSGIVESYHTERKNTKYNRFSTQIQLILEYINNFKTKRKFKILQYELKELEKINHKIIELNRDRTIMARSLLYGKAYIYREHYDKSLRLEQKRMLTEQISKNRDNINKQPNIDWEKYKIHWEE